MSVMKSFAESKNHPWPMFWIQMAGVVLNIGLTVSLLTIAGIFQLFDGVQVVSIGALRAMKDVKVPTLLGLIGYWGIGFPVGIFLGSHRGMGVTGYWTGRGIGLGVAAFTMSIRLAVKFRFTEY